MGFINFAQGSKENYNAQEMQDTIYLSGDSKELLFNDKSYGNATPADEEDITAESGNLKLKDRSYDEASFSGKGHVILRKNISEGKNILTQEMINQPNTIYEIRYDFDLNGASITIPENCILDFQGGSLKNGKIIGNNTSIKAGKEDCIFKLEVQISGTWLIYCIYDSWFEYYSDTTTPNNSVITNIFSLSNNDIHNTIYFDAPRTYWFELPYKGNAALGLEVRPEYSKLYEDFVGINLASHKIL